MDTTMADEGINSEAAPKIEVVLIHPQGDLDLIVRGEKRLRVETGILRLASKVFAAMLSATWAEGQQTFTSTSPGSIELPDDDPSAMQVLCQILHMKILEAQPDKLTCNDILKISMLGEKYDVVAALKSTIMYRAQKLSRTISSVSDDIDLLAASYLMKDNDRFLEQSKKLVMNYASDLIKGMSDVHGDALPSDIMCTFATRKFTTLQLIGIGVLLTQRSQCRLKAVAEVNAIVAKCLESYSDVWEGLGGPTLKVEDPQSFKVIAELSGLPNTWANLSLTQISESIVAFRKLHPSARIGGSHLNGYFEPAARRMGMNVQGLCLKCYLKGSINSRFCDGIHTE